MMETAKLHTVRPRQLIAGCLLAGLLLLLASGLGQAEPAQPTQSGPILVDVARRRVWLVNPDNNSLATIDADSLSLIRERPICQTPTSLAMDNQDQLWVTCRGEDSLKVVDAADGSLIRTVELAYGAAPVSIVFSPDGSQGFVAEYGAGRISHLAPDTGEISASLALGATPRGLAISPDGGRLLISRFITAGSSGTVWEVALPDFILASTITLPLDTTTVDSFTAGRGLPNYLVAVAISPDGQQARIAAKKDNILRGHAVDGQTPMIDAMVRALVSRLDLTAGQEQVDGRLDLDNHSQPSALLFSPDGRYLFVTMQGNNRVLVLDTASGTELVRASTGLAPQGIALDPATNRLFTKNFLGRNVTVFDAAALLETGQPTLPAVATIPTVSIERLPPEVLLGKRIFFNAADTRLIRDGLFSCAACHMDGEHDGQVWDSTNEGEGLRNTIDLRGRRGTGHGLVHWTANFDEIQDFEFVARFILGGSGFMYDYFFWQGTRYAPLGDPKAGYSAELDGLAAFLETFDQAPRSPYRAADGSLTPQGRAGRQVFQSSGCTSCHGGPDFTDRTLHDVGTLKPGSGTRLGQPLTGIETPTLKGMWASPPYLHDGSAATPAAVFEQGSDYAPHGLVRRMPASDQDNLIAYLLQIDEAEARCNRPVMTLTVADTGFTHRVYLPIIFGLPPLPDGC